MKKQVINEIEKLVKELNLNCIIEQFKEKVDWNYISIHQKLSEDFIRECKEKVNWDIISIYQKLSEDFIHEFNIIIKNSNWLYKSAENKLQEIKNTGLYEITPENNIIAYKGIRSDNYSKYNFQYFYEIGKTYSSHCDCNINNENSFGLSGWTKEGALEYCNEKLIKILIYPEHIGALVYKGNKIRCFEFTVIEEIKE